MSHHDKKFKNESQDARRRDEYEKVHANNKKEKNTVKLTHKNKISDYKK